MMLLDYDSLAVSFDVYCLEVVQPLQNPVEAFASFPDKVETELAGFVALEANDNMVITGYLQEHRVKRHVVESDCLSLSPSREGRERLRADILTPDRGLHSFTGRNG